MKTSTIVNAANVSSKFNTAIQTVVNNCTELHSTILTLSNVMVETSTNFRCVVAGGVLRDALLGEAYEDVDVFILDLTSQEFKDVYKKMALITGEYLDTSAVDSYGIGFTSVKIGNINLINKSEYYETPEEVLESFTGSCSKIGYVINGNNDTEQLIYCHKGMVDLLLNKRIEFVCNLENFRGARKYINKISEKSWAEGYTFYVDHESYREEALITSGGLGISSRSTEIETYVAINMAGVLSSNGSISMALNEIYTAIGKLQVYSINVYINEPTANIWVQYMQLGINELKITDQLIWLSEMEANIYVNHHLYNYSHPDNVFALACGQWTPDEMNIYNNKTAYLGWDAIFVDNTLEDSIAYGLWKAGKHRIVLQNSTSIEVFLSTYGLNNKVIGRSGNNLRGFGWNFQPSLSRLKKFLDVFSVKGKIVQPCESYEQLMSAIAWGHIFGRNYTLLDSNTLSHPDLAFEHKIEIPSKYQAQVAKSASICSWLFEHKLSVVWNKRTAKECVLTALELKYPDADVEELFKKPSLISVFQFITEQENKDVEHDFIPVDLESGSLGLTLLDKKDPINLYIGEYTSCCQKLNGYGDSVCREGWTDQYSVNYIFRSVTSKDIVAHMWVWQDVDNNYVIDSIEGKGHTNVEDVTYLVKEFAKLCKEKGISVLLSKTGYGLTGDVAKAFNSNTSYCRCQGSKTKYTYMDASIGNSIHIVSNAGNLETSSLTSFKESDFDDIDMMF